MEEFPGNANRPAVGQGPRPEDTDKKVESVVANEVIRRKTPMTKRFFQTFFGADAKTVFDFVLYDVLIPAAKDTVSDMVSQGIDRALFGTTRSSRGRFGSRPISGNQQYVSYNRFSGPTAGQREPSRNISDRARMHHEFDDIILATRPEAEMVIDRLIELIDRYQQATVRDLYDLVQITGNYTDNKYGWTDLRGAQVVRDREGYLLRLPAPRPL